MFIDSKCFKTLKYTNFYFEVIWKNDKFVGYKHSVRGIHE